MNIRQLQSLFFIALYGVALIRPIAPYVEYMVRKGYISEFLCINGENPDVSCHGKCYLLAKIKHANDPGRETNQIPPPNIEPEKFPFVLLDPYTSSREMTAQSRTIHRWYIPSRYAYDGPDIPTPPPEEYISDQPTSRVDY